MSTQPALYPPAPPGIPSDLTTPPPRYRLLVVVVLASLLLFVLLYLALVAGTGYLVYWSVTFPLRDVNKFSLAVKVGVMSGSAMLFLFLLKGLFKTRKVDSSHNIPVTEAEQPELYAFVRQLCRDTGAPFPRRIYVSHEVNAAVFYDSSLLSLILPVRKNLLIGLGLVNTLDLGEFKAVLAHEFGHFSQKSMKLGTYVYTANGIISDMVYGRDHWDNLLRQWQCLDIRISFPAWGLAGVVWVLRKVLAGIYRIITLGNLALMRQMEFNADLVAVSVTGSDALIHALARLDFANQSLLQAVRDLQDASDHKLYSADLFFHQTQAARYLRQLRHDPQLGQPPALPPDSAGRSRVFQPGEGVVPTMWATHPSNHDREENAKRHYIRSAADDRSPWLLFRHRDDLCGRVTRQVYQLCLGSPAEQLPLAPPAEVQQFIDAEHAEMTHDDRYHGLYYGRLLEPGRLDELLRHLPAPRAELTRRHAALYPANLKERMDAYRQRLAELEQLNVLRLGLVPMKGKEFTFRKYSYQQKELPQLTEMVQEELEEDRRWQQALDREVLLVNYQMATYQNPPQASELADRYRFHLEVQGLLNKLGEQRGRVDGMLQFLATRPNLDQAAFREMLGIFSEAYRALEDSVQATDRLRLPRLRNMTEGQLLGRFLLEERLVPGPSLHAQSLDGAWIQAFLKQLALVLDRLSRVHAKSYGGILALQEQIGKEWVQAAAPATAEASAPATGAVVTS
jgi:Zn-dependent protease with chaperone function